VHIRLWGRVYFFTKKKCILYSLLLLIICGIIGYIPVRISTSATGVSEDTAPEVTYYLPKATICPTQENNINATNRLIAVHITGCVMNPGVFYLPSDTLLIDVINQAGGFTQEADISVANLAKRLCDGMQIRIPSHTDTDKTWLLSEGTPLTGGDTSGSIQATKVNINTATLSELMTLSGIGESTAKSIIAYRTDHGLFKDIKDIMNVPGIKEGKYNKIKDDICVSS